MARLNGIHGGPDRGVVLDDEPTRRVILTRASRIKPLPTHWVWDTAAPDACTGPEGRLPAGAFTIAAGRAGIGKSQWATWLAAHLTTGTLPGCHHGTPKPVIYGATEDSWERTIVPRLVAAGADLDLVYRVDVRDIDDPGARVTLPKDTHGLAEAIRDHDVAAVILDPLLSMVDAGVNDYRAREVRAALEPLVTVADQTGAVIVGVAHFTKAVGNDPLALVSGSAAFGQLVRAAIGFARDDDTDDPTFVLSQIKNNLGREDVPSLAYTIDSYDVPTETGTAYSSRFVIGEATDRSVRDMLSAAADPSNLSERREAEQWLDHYLATQGGEAPAADVLKAGAVEGFSRDNLKRAKGQRVRSEKSGFGTGWVWRLTGYDPEGSAKRAKGAPLVHVLPSRPSLPSRVTA